MNLRLKFVCFWLILAMRTPAQSSAQLHAFTVKDDIAMARFNDPSFEVNDPRGSTTKYSPNGRYAAVVTSKGLLQSDEVESDISVFDLSEVSRYLRDPSSERPRPRIVATVVARPFGNQITAFSPVIKDIRWSANSARLYFLKRTPDGTAQIAETSLVGNEVRTLSPPEYDVRCFDVVAGTVAFLASHVEDRAGLDVDAINRDAFAVTGLKLRDILFPKERILWHPKTLVLGISHEGKDTTTHFVTRFKVEDSFEQSDLFPFALSPDARQLISVLPVPGVPETWKQYEPVAAYQQLRLNGHDPDLNVSDNPLRPREYALTDLETGRTTALVNAPNAWSLGHPDVNSAVWAVDGKRVLVTNTFVPEETMPDRNRPCSVASVDLPSLEMRCMFFREKDAPEETQTVKSARFGKDDNEVKVSMSTLYSEAHSVRVFRLENGRWERDIANTLGVQDRPSSSAHSGSETTKLFIKQTLNDPPTLWASDPEEGKSRLLWNPNPQLANLLFGQASIYRWKDNAGREWTGGLVKPVGYEPGKRYPLVLQMYQFHEDRFLTDGTEPSAFAARELASAGFVVLQIRKRPSLISEEDPQIHLEAYRSAIDSLSNAGLIDRSKVGVVGFSWTCWYAVNAIVKAPKLFAAATVADGLDNSYMQYVLFAPDETIIREQMDRIRGGSPFGADQQRWFAEAPGFHLDQVETPVRIEVINPMSVLQEWELYSSLRMQHKPVDLIYFPEGVHIHQRPQERLESQQGNVDWMRFWLKGYVDPDPSKHAQYERWEKMRDARSPQATASPIQ
jgi:hypothetical protein